MLKKDCEVINLSPENSVQAEGRREKGVAGVANALLVRGGSFFWETHGIHAVPSIDALVPLLAKVAGAPVFSESSWCARGLAAIIWVFPIREVL